MAHFAQLDEQGLVIEIVRVANEELLDDEGNEVEKKGVDFLHDLFGDDKIWKQTSYSGSFRKNYAGIGYTYDSGRDAFIPPQPFPSWTLDEDLCTWYPPVPRPDDHHMYLWSEKVTNWILLEEIPVEDGE